MYPGERTAFVITLLLALPAAALIGFFLHQEIGLSQVALLIVVAMVYVTLARGRLVGSSVRIHETQYPAIFAAVKRCAAILEIPMPLVFVREDFYNPVVALGFGEPYSLILSSSWVEHFKEDELAFMIGRELGHIASGHTRFTSLLSANGSENAIVALVFGAWLRRTELTCDRVGLLCCGSLDAAMRAISFASFHHFARHIDHNVFAEQAAEVQADQMLRLGEWLGAVPYATRRMKAMRDFMATERYRALAPWFARAIGEPPALVIGADKRVVRGDCAGWWRRASAWVIDCIAVFALVQLLFAGAGSSVYVSTSKGGNVTVSRDSSRVKVIRTGFSVGRISIGPQGVVFDAGNGRSVPLDWNQVRSQARGTFLPFWFILYFVLLVTVVGQTPGMMITGLRVVRVDFHRPRIWQALWRYAMVLVLFPFIIALSPFSKVYLHDMFSRTRLIKSERALARAIS